MMNDGILREVIRRLVEEQKHELDRHDGVFVMSPWDVVMRSKDELDEEWHHAHVMSTEDMHMAIRMIYDAIVDHYYLEDVFDEFKLDELYNIIVDKLDAEHRNYVGYDE